MTPSPKKWSCPFKIFFPIFSKNVAFLEKLLNVKIFKTSFLLKKRLYSFSSPGDVPFPSKETWAPETVVLPFSQKIQPLLKKLLNIKVFYTFVIKKSYVNFWRKTPPFSKKLLKVPPKQFFSFLRKWGILKKSIGISKLKFLSIIDNIDLIDKY